MKGLKFLYQNPKLSWTWKLHKNPMQMDSYQSTKFSLFFKLFF